MLRITSGAVPAPGERVHVTARAEGVLLFAAGTGLALLPEALAAAHV